MASRRWWSWARLGSLALLVAACVAGGAAQTRPLPGNTVQLRVAVIPGVFNNDDASATEEYVLKATNVSVRVIFEEQPKDANVYLQLMKSVYLPSNSYDVYMFDMLWTQVIGDFFLDLAAENFTDLCPYSADAAELLEMQLANEESGDGGDDYDDYDDGSDGGDDELGPGPGSGSRAGSGSGFAPQQPENATACDFFKSFLSEFWYVRGGRYIAAPLYGDVAVFYYRDDLVNKYLGQIHPPPYATYAELIQAAQYIMEQENINATESPRFEFNGYLFEGSVGEGLTAVALEWIYANGGGTIIDSTGKVTINNPMALEALYNATQWMSGVVPQSITGKDADMIASSFEACHSAFMRNSPQHFQGIEIRCAGLPQVVMTTLPMASTIGGWGMAVPADTPNRRLAVEVVKYLTSKEMQLALQQRLDFMPTRRSALAEICLDPYSGEVVNDFYGCAVITASFQGVGQLERPTRYAGAAYTNISTYFATWVNKQLTSKPTFAQLQANLQQMATDLNSILNTAGPGDFCGFANSVEILCQDGLTCVNSVCYNFTPLIYGTRAGRRGGRCGGGSLLTLRAGMGPGQSARGAPGLSISVGVLLIALIAYILLLHYRKKHGASSDAVWAAGCALALAPRLMRDFVAGLRGITGVGGLTQWGTYSIAWSDVQLDDKPVGRGTFGVVYHGRYRNTEVAIKRIINQDRASEVVSGTGQPFREGSIDRACVAALTDTVSCLRAGGRTAARLQGRDQDARVAAAPQHCAVHGRVLRQDQPGHHHRVDAQGLFAFGAARPAREARL